MISGRSRFLIPLFLNAALLGPWTSAWSQGKFAYVANGFSNNVSAYTIDATTGALTQLPGSPFPAGAGPQSVAVHPSGQFAYVANLISSVSAFTVDAKTGALRPVLGSPFPAGVSPQSVVVHPSGQFAYVANCDILCIGMGTVSAYTISATTGVLTPVPGSPFPAGVAPQSVAVHPSGQFAYVANCGSGFRCSGLGDVSAYTIDALTGALTPIAGSPFPAGVGANSVAVHPSGQFAYVANNTTPGTVTAFTIDAATGALTTNPGVPGSPFPAGAAPSSITIDPSGQFAYVANRDSADVSAYTIDALTGALTPIAGSPFPAGVGAHSVTVDPSGQFAYVANCGNSICTGIGSVSAYTIDAATGALSPVAGSPFPAGTSSVSVTTTAGPNSGISGIQQIGALTVTGAPSGVLVDETRNKIYVADSRGGTIQVFDGNTHQLLTTITGCATGNGAWVIDQVFGKIYAGCDDLKVRVIDTATDTLTKVIDIHTSIFGEFKLAIDQTRHNVWISHHPVASFGDICVVDVPTDSVRQCGDTQGAGFNSSLSVNETTNRVYVVHILFPGGVVEIDGDTLLISRSLPVPFPIPVQSGINRGENKLYVNIIGGTTICIYNMNQASSACTPIARNDWGGIVTNETTNKVYLGVEVGHGIGILDGASDGLTEIPMDQATGVGGQTNQSHEIVVNETTNHIFFVNQSFLLVLDGPTLQMARCAYADLGGGSPLAQAVAINRSNNRIYVIYDGAHVNKVAVFQDR